MANQKLRETFDVILGQESDSGPGIESRNETRNETTSEDRVHSVQDSGTGAGSTREIPTLPSHEVDRFVSLAEGGFFYPNFISDYLMQDLSLGEQSVFNRLLRLSQGMNRLSGKLKVKDVAEACGISPAFAARTLESLQEKGLMRVVRNNRFTRSIRYRLDVLKQWQGKLVLCAVCHGPISPEDARTLLPVARSVNGIQEVPVHVDCLTGDPCVSHPK